MTERRCPVCGLSRAEFVRHELTAMGVQPGRSDEDLTSRLAHDTFGSRPMTQPGDTADQIARIVASWTFPLVVLALIVIWLTVNLTLRPFAPFPTVMLAVISAVLATLGALQGPIILRVQRRQRQRDRDRDEIDHIVNLKAELEIRWLDHKLDHLLTIGGTDPRAPTADPAADDS